METETAMFALELAKGLQKEVVRQGLAGTVSSKSVSAKPIDRMQMFDQLIPGGPIAKASRKLFADGHYRQAIIDAYICIDTLVKRKAKQADTGCSLMRTVFSPRNPLLRLNELATESQQNEQQGYMDMFAGAIMGIRNPRAHDHDWPDDEVNALQLLHFAHHLATRVEIAKRPRKKK